MDTSLINLYSKVGENGTPVKKLSSEDKKELRTIIKKLQNIDNLPETLRLRINLAINSPINTELKTADTISVALDLKDILKTSSKLSKKEEIVDSSDYFKAVNDAIKKSKSTKIIKPTINSILKWLKWVQSSEGKLTDKTEESLTLVLKSLVSLIQRPKNLNDNIVKKQKNLITPILDILFVVTSNSRHNESYILSLNLMNAIENKFPSLIIEDILSDVTISKKLKVLEEHILSVVEHNISNGNAGILAKLFSSLQGISFINLLIPFKEMLQKVWETQGGALDIEMQSFIKTTLFNEPIVYKTFELTTQESSSSIMQLSTVLLSSWEARNDGPRAKDSFNLLISIAKKYFNLNIGGVVGEITKFNKIAHETLGNSKIDDNSNIEIIRPWIEWESSEKKSIIIKALVKPFNKI